MIFLHPNIFNTITIASVTTGTSTISNMIDRKTATQFQSSGDNDDTTTTTISLDFFSTQTMSNIALLNHNLQNYSVYYNNTTTNVFSPDITFTTNSATSQYFSFTTVTTITNITLVANETITADEEKKIGEFYTTKLFYDFDSDRLPAAKGYKPQITQKQVRHVMSDGGVQLYNIAQKFKTQIKMDFVPTSTEVVLRSIFDSADHVVFLPFDTTTAWDAQLYPVVWTGPYNFVEFADNNRNIGYKGNINLEEIPGRV